MDPAAALVRDTLPATNIMRDTDRGGMMLRTDIQQDCECVSTAAILGRFRPPTVSDFMVRKPIIYALSLCGIVVYVGQTTHWGNRFGDHDYDKYFDECWVLDIPEPPDRGVEYALLPIECYWINTLSPFFNTANNDIKAHCDAYLSWMRSDPRYVTTMMPTLANRLG
jgi:hypothetical protein